MIWNRSIGRILIAGAAAPALAPAPALAAPCASLPSPIDVAGSSAIRPFIQLMGTALSAQMNPVTLVYQSQGSCTGVNAVVNDATPMGACAMGACIMGTA